MNWRCNRVALCLLIVAPCLTSCITRSDPDCLRGLPERVRIVCACPPTQQSSEVALNQVGLKGIIRKSADDCISAAVKAEATTKGSLAGQLDACLSHKTELDADLKKLIVKIVEDAKLQTSASMQTRWEECYARETGSTIYTGTWSGTWVGNTSRPGFPARQQGDVSLTVAAGGKFTGWISNVALGTNASIDGIVTNSGDLSGRTNYFGSDSLPFSGRLVASTGVSLSGQILVPNVGTIDFFLSPAK